MYTRDRPGGARTDQAFVHSRPFHRLKGEEWDGFNETNTDAPVIQINPPIIPTNSSNSDDTQNPSDQILVDPQPNPETPSETDETLSEPELRPKRIRKPTERV